MLLTSASQSTKLLIEQAHRVIACMKLQAELQIENLKALYGAYYSNGMF